MKNKLLVQLLLVVLIIMSFFAYYNFFEKKNKNKISNKTEIKKIELTNPEASNTMSSIKYSSADDIGNQYEITSRIGEVNINNSDLIFMTDVKATINLVDSEPIIITSDFAEYNNKDYETDFFQNVLIAHINHKISSGNLSLSFKKNEAYIFNKVFYNNNITKLKADKVKIDLLTKDIKILMDDETKKINIITKN